MLFAVVRRDPAINSVSLGFIGQIVRTAVCSWVITIRAFRCQASPRFPSLKLPSRAREAEPILDAFFGERCEKDAKIEPPNLLATGYLFLRDQVFRCIAPLAGFGDLPLVVDALE